MRDRRTVREDARRSSSGSARTWAAMLVQMADRGPDTAGVAVYRDPAPTAGSKLTLYSADPSRAWDGCRRAARRARGGDEPRCRASHAVVLRRGRRRRGRGVDPREAPAAAGDERGPRDRDLQGGRRPARVRRAVRARRLRRHARARPHADGDREPRHDRGLAPVLDRARPVPRPQRLALEPQPAAPRASGARGSSSRPRTTPRSPPATSPGGCARARRCRRRSRAASTTSTASTRSSSAPPTGSRCCATRSRASRP